MEYPLHSLSGDSCCVRPGNRSQRILHRVRVPCFTPTWPTGQNRLWSTFFSRFGNSCLATGCRFFLTPLDRFVFSTGHRLLFSTGHRFLFDDFFAGCTPGRSTAMVLAFLDSFPHALLPATAPGRVLFAFDLFSGDLLSGDLLFDELVGMNFRLARLGFFSGFPFGIH